MNASTRIAALLSTVHRRSDRRLLGFAVPLVVLLLAVAARLGGPGFWASPATPLWVAAALVIVVAVLAVVAAGLRRRYSSPWLLARLDEQVPALEDSSALALQPVAAAGIAGLQQARIAQRLATLPLPDQRPPLHGRWMMLVWLLALTAAVLLLRWPPIVPVSTLAAEAAAPQAPPGPGQTAVSSVRLQITPPAYTGLPVSEQAELDARVAEGSQLRWTVRFDPQPQSAALAFVDGRSVALQRSGDDWIAAYKLEQPTLYRLGVDAAAPPLVERNLHTLGLVVDAPPQLRVIAPALSLTRHDPTQSIWALELEASDDYGLGAAELLLTRTQGSGEQVSVSEQRIVLSGRGDRRQRHYSHRVDLTALGFAEGDDLIARFTIADGRQPKPQSTRSPSFILRWPPPPIGEAGGVDGLVNTTLPAYFRSQRQIIIDTEALIGKRAELSADDFGVRSDTIGVDQRVLRLRYGQFLGEEFEPPAPPPGLAGGGEHAEHEGDEHADGHEHGGASEGGDGAATFGDAGAVQAEYGHTHDIAEAATLLDPATRKLLKSALDEMWQAELFLRTAQPKAALPYEYRALEFIKQVQQASRICLARVGLELPAIDFNRRMTGDRTGLRPRTDPLRAASREADVAAASWRALDALADPRDADAQTRQRAALDALLAWLATAAVDADQRLALLAAADALQQDPACADCLEQLRIRLWPLLQSPPAALEPREPADAVGKAYLDALDTPAGVAP